MRAREGARALGEETRALGSPRASKRRARSRPSAAARHPRREGIQPACCDDSAGDRPLRPRVQTNDYDRTVTEAPESAMASTPCGKPGPSVSTIANQVASLLAKTKTPSRTT